MVRSWLSNQSVDDMMNAPAHATEGHGRDVLVILSRAAGCGADRPPDRILPRTPFPNRVERISVGMNPVAASSLRSAGLSRGEAISTRRAFLRSRLRRRANAGILADVAGRKPAGWFSLPRQGDRDAVGAVSPNTIALLLEAGYVYLGNGLADGIPHYWVSDFASRRAELTEPYYYHFVDQFFLMFRRKGTCIEHRTRCCATGVASLPRSTGGAAISR